MTGVVPEQQIRDRLHADLDGHAPDIEWSAVVAHAADRATTTPRDPGRRPRPWVLAVALVGAAAVVAVVIALLTTTTGHQRLVVKPTPATPAAAPGTPTTTHPDVVKAFHQVATLGYVRVDLVANDGRTLWILVDNGRTAGTGGVLVHVDAASGKVLATIKVGTSQSYLHDLAVGEGSVWVLDWSTLYRINPMTHAVTPIAMPREAERLAVGFGKVWVTTCCANGPGPVQHLSRVNPNTNRVDGEATLGGCGESWEVAIGQDVVWATGECTTKVIGVDPKRMAVTRQLQIPQTDTIPANGSQAKMAITAGGVWVSPTSGTSTLYELNPLTGALVRTVIALPDIVTHMVAGPSGLWISTESPALVRVDPSSGVVTTYQQTPTGASVASVSKRVWLTKGSIIIALDP